MAGTYGDKAPEVAKLAQFTGKRWPVVGRRLVDEFPYLEAEVKYAVKEYACTAVDVLARRTRLAFLHVHAADEAIPKIINILAKELGWSKPRMKVTNMLQYFTDDIFCPSNGFLVTECHMSVFYSLIIELVAGREW